MIDSSIYTYEKLTKMVVVDAAERKRLTAIGIRPLKRESKLSQAPISNAIKGVPVKLRTLAIIRKRQWQTVLTPWFAEILPGVFGCCLGQVG